jgi:hypothetical protein
MRHRHVILESGGAPARCCIAASTVFLLTMLMILR